MRRNSRDPYSITIPIGMSDIVVVLPSVRLMVSDAFANLMILFGPINGQAFKNAVRWAVNGR